MVVANSNNCSNCSMHECVNRQWTFFFHPGHIYVQVSLPTPVIVLDAILTYILESVRTFQIEL